MGLSPWLRKRTSRLMFCAAAARKNCSRTNFNLRRRRRCDFNTRPFSQTRRPVSIAYTRAFSNSSDTPSHRESAFSLFKRGLNGAFHKVSLKHLQRYLEEFAYRFNNRKSPDLFGMTVARMAKIGGMTY